MNYSSGDRWYYSLLFWGLFFIDIMSKKFAVSILKNGNIVHLFPFLSFRLHYNFGISWGLLSSLPGRTIIIPLAMIGIMSLLVMHTTQRQNEGHSVFGETLLIAGGFGNLIDRLGDSLVVDFIHVHFGSYSFPIFNIADIAITCGAFIMLYNFLLGDDE